MEEETIFFFNKSGKSQGEGGGRREEVRERDV